MASNTESNMRKANRFLANLDQRLAQLVEDIEMEKDINDGENGQESRRVISTQAVNNFIRTINAIKITDSEEILMAINSRYDEAIKVVKEAIRNGDPYYRQQMENELRRIEKNKGERFDPIQATYGEFVKRVERGEVQQDYFQAKADEVAGEISANEEKYKQKYGNIDIILATVKQPFSKVVEKDNIYIWYEKLKDLNNEIEQKTSELSNPNIPDEDKEELEQEINALEEKRAGQVKLFEERATDKDGRKYKREDGKSDKEYIEEIDEDRIYDAMNAAIWNFRNEIDNIPLQFRTFTELDKNLNETEILDAVQWFKELSTARQINDVIQYLKEQKQQWQGKVKTEGYDKTKLIHLQEEFQKEANRFAKLQEENSNGILPAVKNTTYLDRYRENRKKMGIFKSFFKATFGKKRMEQEMAMKSNKGIIGDISETKKKALEYLSENTGELNQINVKDNKKESFKRNLNYNVGLVQTKINKSWEDSTRESAKDDEKQK